MIHGVLGRPYVDLEPLLDLAALPRVHEEVCLGLAQVPLDYTGGSHRSMRIMPPSREHEAYVDYGEVIASMDDAAYATFVALADDPSAMPPRAEGATFGEERDHALSRRQMLWLEHRFGVYFPWKAYLELIPNHRWEEKAEAGGKDFTRLARTYFPETVRFVKTLPFVAIGRCNIMGLKSMDHGTVHRDGVPEEKPDVDHFIMLSPAPTKRLFLWDEETKAKTHVAARAFWFNDSDWHGVEADPAFRYSIRVDGVFEPGFLERVKAHARGGTA